MLISDAKSQFPSAQGTSFEQWILKRCILSPEDSVLHHQSIDVIWRKLQDCFPPVGEFILSEPIFRDAMQRLLGQLAGNKIMYVDFRLVLSCLRFRRAGQIEVDENGVDTLFRVFGEEIDKFKRTAKGAGFRGARMI